MRSGKQIVESRQFLKAEEVYPAVLYLAKKGQDEENTVAEICKYDRQFEMLSIVFERIAHELYIKAQEEIRQNVYVQITENELTFLKQIEDVGERKLLLLLLVAAKQSNHPSGWDNYAKTEYMRVLGVAKKPEKYAAWIQPACEQGYVELRVVGSKNPILCFKLSFRDDDGPVVGQIKTVSQLDTFFEEYCC